MEGILKLMHTRCIEDSIFVSYKGHDLYLEYDPYRDIFTFTDLDAMHEVEGDMETVLKGFDSYICSL